MDFFKALIPTVIPMDFFIKAKKVKIANFELSILSTFASPNTGVSNLSEMQLM